MQEITEIISTVGFPIVLVLILLFDSKDQRERHAEESLKWRDALNNNTSVMEQVLKVVTELKERWTDGK